MAIKAQERFLTRMRYFIFYPPTKSIRLIDVPENIRVEDVLRLVREEFGLKNENDARSEASIVLSYNGFDLKPKWSLTDLGIPSGAIIRCIYREQKAAELYIHCGFNKQLLKLFDTSITIESTIGSIRKKIADRLGLPLSVFCLESYDGKQRFYDQMKLINYDIKIHDHIFLKVWNGYEKFLCSCIRGYVEQYSHDDLTRHYQTQVALHIAAFYGHMELAHSVMQHGARSDRPVGEHPSRQWSFEAAATVLPDSLKCPIHIAIERGHVKMVDLFVRNSILCTQCPDPITDYLPFQIALRCMANTKSKEEKQCFSEIYFYLHDKQFQLKIPLNANGAYVSSLLTSTAANSTVHRTGAHHVNVSLPVYCRIISWHERARERVWKKYGGHFHTTQAKRIYPNNGLLGYKVLIDGFNNTFDVPTEQLQKTTNEKSHRYVGYSDEEREKIIRTKAAIKQLALDERQRAKQIAASNLQARRQLLATDDHKLSNSTIQFFEGLSTVSDLSNSQILSSLSPLDLKANDHLVSLELISPIQSIESPRKTKTKTKRKPLPIIPTAIVQKNEPTLSPQQSTGFQPVMSSVDAYLISSNRLARETEQNQTTKKRQLLTELEQSTQQDKQSSVISTQSNENSMPIERDAMLDVDSYIPLPEHSNYLRNGPIKSRVDLQIRQSTFQPYERYASATIRSTAVNCLEEATFFKRKSWLQQVELSKEMIKHRVQRRIHRVDNQKTKKPSLIPLRAPPTTHSQLKS